MSLSSQGSVCDKSNAVSSISYGIGCSLETIAYLLSVIGMVALGSCGNDIKFCFKKKPSVITTEGLCLGMSALLCALGRRVNGDTVNAGDFGKFPGFDEFVEIQRDITHNIAASVVV